MNMITNYILKSMTLVSVLFRFIEMNSFLEHSLKNHEKADFRMKIGNILMTS